MFWSSVYRDLLADSSKKPTNALLWTWLSPKLLHVFSTIFLSLSSEISYIITAEEFIVPIAHAVVIKLFTKEMIKEKDYQQRGKGVYLTRIGREKVLLELEKRLEKKIRFKGINTTIRNAIYHQARHLAAYIKKEIRTYEIANIPE